MGEKKDEIYLMHIQDAILKIEKYTKDCNYENFSENSLIQDGVIRQLQIISEATKLITEEKRKEYTDIPWKDISGMRDKLIHSYFGVDLEAVWVVVKQDLPILKENISILFNNMKY